MINISISEVALFMFVVIQVLMKTDFLRRRISLKLTIIGPYLDIAPCVEERDLFNMYLLNTVHIK